jgi:hypothetical protein
MIPPCPLSILEKNSQFKRLYENLTANLLNPDGSSVSCGLSGTNALRGDSADPTRQAVAEVGRGASQNHPHHNKDQAEIAVADHSLSTGSKTMSNTERKEADQGVDA